MNIFFRIKQNKQIKKPRNNKKIIKDICQPYAQIAFRRSVKDSIFKFEGLYLSSL